MPKRLYLRALLILVLPSIFVATISTYVFIERHMEGITKRLASDIAGDVSAVIEIIESQNFYDLNIQKFAKSHFGFEIKIDNKYKAQSFMRTPVRLIGAKFMIAALQKKIPYPYNVTINRNSIFIDVFLPSQIIHLKMDRLRLLNHSTELFLVILLGVPLLFLMVSAIFLRNQVRPIRRLARAADRFGKGQEIENFKPEGAYEVRQAGLAFNQMRERIARQIRQRTEMLAGVSHDLRTPLTRMELQLAMMEKTPEILDLHEDVRELRKMVGAFLDFAHGEKGEKSQNTDLKELLKGVASNFREKITVTLTQGEAIIDVRPYAMRRCFQNLLENADRFGSHVWVHLKKHNKTFTINIDDDGPGIPNKYHKEVFKPFFRLDQSRNQDKGGSVGLGLSIAHDFIHQHGGYISLEDSPHGGLRVRIELPR